MDTPKKQLIQLSKFSEFPLFFEIHLNLYFFRDTKCAQEATAEAQEVLHFKRVIRTT